MPGTLHLSAADPRDIARAADILRVGGTVAFPTETVYGLGANALDPDAVARIFTAKQRPAWDPLIVHVAAMEDVRSLVHMRAEVRPRTEALAAAFWPGPLTLLLPRREHVPDSVTAGSPLVGIRVPAHPAAQALLRACGLPLAAPSANRFGHTSPTTARHVLDDLDGRIDAVLDAGPTSIGLESTVLDPTPTPMILYRPGALTLQQLETAAGAALEVLKEVFTTPGKGAGQPSPEAGVQSSLPAPGVGLRHYAPNARLVLTGDGLNGLQVALANLHAPSQRVGILLPSGWEVAGAQHIVQPWASWDDPAALAATLFAGLRALEAHGAEVIYCPLPVPGGLRDAIRDRLQKAARSI